MSDTMHIVRKDVRRLRWLLALLIVVPAGRVMLSASDAAAAGGSIPAELFLLRLSGAIVTIELLLTALIVARLVHDEPLVGLTAFWLTRPYRRATLIRAKLLFAVIAFVGLPLFADFTTMTLVGADLPALVRGGAAAAGSYAVGALSLMVIATLTPSLGVFVMTLLGIVAGTSMLAVAMVSLAAFGADTQTAYVPPVVPDATPGIVTLAVYLCAALGVVVYQYRHRRWRVATALAIAGLAATVVAPMLWPWPFARGGEIQPGAWAAGAAATHDPSWGTEVTDVSRFGRGAPMRHVNARVALSGAPLQITAYRVGVRSTLRFPDGTTFESSQEGGFESSFRTATAEAALGGVRLLAARDVFEQGWTPMVTLSEEAFTRYRGRSGRLDADVHFELLRTRESGTLPLTPGAAFDDGVCRVGIVDVQRRTGGRDVTLRRWCARSLLATTPPAQQRQFALRHRARGEALMGGTDTTWTMGRRSSAVMSLLLLPLGVSMGFEDGDGGGGFDVATMFLRFPGPGFGKAPSLDAAWFDEAELVVLETEPAGVVTRRLTIEDFAVPGG